jgi:hypothetical protein
LKVEIVTSPNDLNQLEYRIEHVKIERRNKNTPSVVASFPSWNTITESLRFLFSTVVDEKPPVSSSLSIFNKEFEEVATGSKPDTTTPVPDISTSDILSPIADDLRDEFERELPRDPSDCNPDLTNDAALDRGGRGLVVDGAGRLSGMLLFPGFERILLDLRIDIGLVSHCFT